LNKEKKSSLLSKSLANFNKNSNAPARLIHNNNNVEQTSFLDDDIHHVDREHINQTTQNKVYRRKKKKKITYPGSRPKPSNKTINNGTRMIQSETLNEREFLQYQMNHSKTIGADDTLKSKKIQICHTWNFVNNQWLSKEYLCLNPATRNLPTMQSSQNNNAKSNILPTTLPTVDQTLATAVTLLQPVSTTQKPVKSSFAGANASVDSSNCNEDNIFQGSGSQEEISTVYKDSIEFVTHAENSTANILSRYNLIDSFPDDTALNSSPVASSETDPNVVNYTNEESAATIVDLPEVIGRKETELEGI